MSDKLILDGRQVNAGGEVIFDVTMIPGKYSAEPRNPWAPTFELGPGSADNFGVATGADGGTLGEDICWQYLKTKVNTSDLNKLAQFQIGENEYRMILVRKPKEVNHANDEEG